MLKSHPISTLLATVQEAGQTVVAARRSAARHSPAAPDVGLVLDVGSGQGAAASADVVVDKYVADNFERSGEASLDIGKPLVIADGEALPFADGTFSYVVASHVLEHATRPDVFAGELSRTAEAGFVQVPSREGELAFGWPFHPWLVDRDRDELVFEPRGTARAPVGDLLHREYAQSAVFRLWWASRRDLWHHTVHWSGRLAVRVLGESEAPQTATFDTEKTLSALARIGARGPTGTVREALRCPHDRGSLETDSDRLLCRDCGRTYPVANGGVPVLLAESAS